MESKTTILNRIRQIQLASAEDVSYEPFTGDAASPGRFEASLEKVGGQAVHAKDIEDWDHWLGRTYGTVRRVYSQVENFSGNHHLQSHKMKSTMDAMDVAILAGVFGVCENGAVWVHQFEHRAIPFITQHLILILKQEMLLSTMHEAMSKISHDLPGFGAFISGPSKTADIEQSLVYGAHGPRTLKVILT